MLACTGATSAAGIGPLGLSFNGQQVNDEAQFFRAIAASFFPRGNRQSVLQFSATWAFNTVRDCQVFALSHFGTLPVQANLTVYCGDSGSETPAVLAGAVPDEPQVTDIRGLSCTVKYGFKGGLFTIEDSDPGAPAEGGDTMKFGEIDPIAGADSADVVFSVPFGSTPRMPTLTLEKPSKGADGFDLDVYALSATGFSVSFGGLVPSSGYKIHWKAEL